MELVDVKSECRGLGWMETRGWLWEQLKRREEEHWECWDLKFCVDVLINSRELTAG